MGLNKVLKVNKDSELLSFIINTTPELASEIDLPVQGESILPIGKIIMSNERYKNAFLNTINVIGLTIIDRNYWENPWEVFANRGLLPYGQTVRELIVDIANVYDYNAYATDVDHFLENEVPNVYNYLHEINYQKFYKTTTSDEQMAMAFNTEGGLFDLIEKIVASLYEGYKYDKYIVDKYMLCRRIIDGTITPVKIDDYASLTPRQRVAKLKSVSNLMTFRSPNYNPAGVRVSTSFEKQIAIINTDFEADLSTDVLATSFFRNEAEMKSRSALIDGFGTHDGARLTELLGNSYIPFTDAEITALNNIPAVIIDDEWFQDYSYAMDVNGDTKMTDFYNPESLKHNFYLHTWKVISSSPFKNAVVFTTDTPAVTSVVVSPSTATVNKGQDLQLRSVVTTTGFANKATTWSLEGKTGATIDLSGKLKVASNYDNTGSGTAGVWTISIDTILETGDKVIVNGVAYTVDASSEDTIAKQITAMKSALNNAKVTDYFTISGTSTTTTLTQKSGYYGIATPVFSFIPASGSDGECEIDETTEGALAGNVIRVTATSVFDTTQKGTAIVTVA